ncbi:hypothetical protein K7432_008406 [Basidiobolus ranarum]|uniref:Phosphatidic acid phosphatase type 2/haloperoxidase domain-containing protein n=1 Tax=Basidiobolus ranarum TaxID=34480 RepID=A0ABR2VYL9_9FUNG
MPPKPIQVPNSSTRESRSPYFNFDEQNGNTSVDNKKKSKISLQGSSNASVTGDIHTVEVEVPAVVEPFEEEQHSWEIRDEEKPKLVTGLSRLVAWWSWSYLADWILSIVIFVISIGLSYLAPFKREFSLQDLTIAHSPVDSESIPTFLLYFITLVLPLMVILTYHGFHAVYGPSGSRKRTELWPLAKIIHDLHNSVLGLFATVSLIALFTIVLQLAVGKLRPDFLYRCAWEEGTRSCTGDPQRILDGRKAFPSEYASYSFSGMSYVALYLAGKIGALSFNVPPHNHKFQGFVVTLIPLLIATYVALTRAQEHLNSLSDTLSGAILGLTMSYFVYHIYFHDVSGSRSAFPRRLKTDTKKSSKVSIVEP